MPTTPRRWVISDTHFGHANIIRHAERPFRTIGEMNEALVANWNDIVRDGDTVYHLGDFSGPPMNRRIERIAEQLRGRIVLITGNHDRVTPRLANTFTRVTGPQRLRTPVKDIPGVVPQPRAAAQRRNRRAGQPAGHRQPARPHPPADVADPAPLQRLRGAHRVPANHARRGRRTTGRTDPHRAAEESPSRHRAQGSTR